MRILIFGASGMLGSAVFRLFLQSPGFDVIATFRSLKPQIKMLNSESVTVLCGIDAENGDSLARAISAAKPDVIINCIGLVKQLADSKDPLAAIPINSILPHRLARLAELSGSRLIHISTDCVFSGAKGNYVELDRPDADDLYGRSKLLGEVDYPHAITLRTSIVGHELNSATGLIDWFLSQQGRVKGYTNAIFSGLPTIELARVIRDFVLPRPDMRGLYHVSSAPINKYELLQLTKKAYGVQTHVEPDGELKIDRSLNSDRFKQVTGYVPPTWPDLVAEMKSSR